MKKVYCNRCMLFIGDECMHRYNIGPWDSPINNRRKPEIINERNDCKWFELSPFKALFYEK